jgi:hypothetical protein
MRISRLATAAAFRLKNRHLFDDDIQAVHLRQSSDYFQGKSVAVIGNAQSIFDQANGTIIDAHDVVVRLNRGSIRDAASQGSRTDVLCIANPMSKTAIDELFGKPRIIWVTPKRDLMDASLVKDTPCYPIASWKRLSTLLDGRRPSAGLITLFMMRETFAPASISLFGFDWKASKTFYHDQNNMLSWHDWSAEQGLVAAWLAADPRLALNPSSIHSASA